MMSPDDATTRLRAAVADAISMIAPDVADELPDLDPDADLFEEFGLDSMDRLNIMTALTQSTGAEIPDDRYPQLTSMNRWSLTSRAHRDQSGCTCARCGSPEHEYRARCMAYEPRGDAAHRETGQPAASV